MRGFRCVVENKRSLQIESDRIDQLFTGGVFLYFADRFLESGIIVLLPDRLVDFVNKIFNLNICQIVMEGQQGVKVGLKQTRQRRQKGDVRVSAAFLPLAYSRRGNAQIICDLLLRQGQLLSLFPYDLVNLHGGPPLRLCPYDSRAGFAGH